MSQPLPEHIGKYTILGVLGHGAMGLVYKGFDPHINRLVAIKTIHKNLLGDDQAVDSIAARFRNEAQAVGRIAHPGVVAIYELGTDENTTFIAMEYVESRNLEKVLEGTPLLAEAQLLSIMDQLLDALGSAHQQGVWHRDIKPANLLLTASGQLKVTDFGVARIENAGLTQVSAMIGTPGYMSPEQYLGTGVDHRSDLFAAGVLLYRLLTGRAPFTGRPEQVMYQILHEEPVPPSQLGVPPRSAAYDGVVLRALAKDAQLRFASAAAFRQALTAAAAQSCNAGSDATVIVGKATWAHTVQAAATPVPAVDAQRPNLATGAASPSGWDAPTLSRIEHSLAICVGPMAKFMVREAARQCNDAHSLTLAVAQHIGDDHKRQQFIREATVVSQVKTPGSTAAAASSVPGSLLHRMTAVSADPLTEEVTAHALQVLTSRLGPIARIVVKRAAGRASGKAQFIQLLLEACPEFDRELLLGELQAVAGKR